MASPDQRINTSLSARWVKYRIAWKEYYTQHPVRTVAGFAGVIGIAFVIEALKNRDTVRSTSADSKLVYKRQLNPKPQITSLAEEIIQLENQLQSSDLSEGARSEMREVLAIKKSEMRKPKSTMSVTSGQVDAREPHWDVRNHERNWSIMLQDQQRQKHELAYRRERSRDDDFSRNTYGSGGGELSGSTGGVKPWS